MDLPSRLLSLVLCLLDIRLSFFLFFFFSLFGLMLCPVFEEWQAQLVVSLIGCGEPHLTALLRLLCLRFAHLYLTFHDSSRQFSHGIYQHSCDQYDHLENLALRIWSLFAFGIGLGGLWRHLYEFSVSVHATDTRILGYQGVI